MDVRLVAALNQRGAIGLENRLPWHLPRDLRHFRAITQGCPVVMGHATHRSIGRALPQRTNIVLSRQTGLLLDGCLVVSSLEEALRTAGDTSPIMIIGGAQVYAQALPLATRLHLTHVENDIEGDAWFPPIDAAVWRTVSEERHAADAENPFACRFVTYERVGTV